MYLPSAIMILLDWLAVSWQLVPFLNPSPPYPLGQEQLKPPGKLWHSLLQGFKVTHSLISRPQCNPSKRVSTIYMFI